MMINRIGINMIPHLIKQYTTTNDYQPSILIHQGLNDNFMLIN